MAVQLPSDVEDSGLPTLDLPDDPGSDCELFAAAAPAKSKPQAKRKSEAKVKAKAKVKAVASEKTTKDSTTKAGRQAGGRPAKKPKLTAEEREAYRFAQRPCLHGYQSILMKYKPNSQTMLSQAL